LTTLYLAGAKKTLGLHLHQHRLMQAQVPLSPVELDLLLPQHLVEAEGSSSDHHHEPSSDKKAKVAKKRKTRKDSATLAQRRL
jgi:hypothetical protein